MTNRARVARQVFLDGSVVGRAQGLIREQHFILFHEIGHGLAAKRFGGEV